MRLSGEEGAETLVIQLKARPDESEDFVAIDQFGMLLFAEAPQVCTEALRVLKDGGIFEVSGVDFLWIVQRYQAIGEVDSLLGDALYGTTRRAVWDEKTLAKVLLLSGFYKAWVGRVTELPRHMILAKALKFKVESPASEK